MCIYMQLYIYIYIDIGIYIYIYIYVALLQEMLEASPQPAHGDVARRARDAPVRPDTTTTTTTTTTNNNNNDTSNSNNDNTKSTANDHKTEDMIDMFRISISIYYYCFDYGRRAQRKKAALS